MNIKSPFGLVVLLAALCVSFALPSLARNMNQITRAKDYQQHVPQNMRTLVTEKQYDKIAASLSEAVPGRGLLDTGTVLRVAASPCGRSLYYLINQFMFNPAVPQALDAVVKGLKDPPPGYSMENPWKSQNAAELLGRMVTTFLDWCVYLPQISGSNDNGLYYIQYFAWFYYQNTAGQDFVQGRTPLYPIKPLLTGMVFTKEFSRQRGAFMNSPASMTYVRQWIDDPRIEISDYQKQRPGEYQSWNDFFSRELIVDRENETIPSRPATMPLSQYPKRDYIVVAPTDCIMNPLIQILTENQTVTRRFIENPLQFDTVLDVKGIPMSLADLLQGVPENYRSPFVGGSGQTCVLMPNTYHHFHAPVNGTVVYAEVVPNNTYGYLDFPNWVPLDGNVGRPGTDFSQFQAFQRGIIIIEVKYADLSGAELTGYVASIPVGLDTIGSVVLKKDIVPGKVVKRGYTELGSFFYGGSLDILLYSKGLASSVVQTRMGNQINLFNVGTTPDVE